MTSSKKTLTLSSYAVPPKKLKSKTSQFFEIETAKLSASSEGLNSSLLLSAGEL